MLELWNQSYLYNDWRINILANDDSKDSDMIVRKIQILEQSSFGKNWGYP